VVVVDVALMPPEVAVAPEVVVAVPVTTLEVTLPVEVAPAPPDPAPPAPPTPALPVLAPDAPVAAIDVVTGSSVSLLPHAQIPATDSAAATKR